MYEKKISWILRGSYLLAYMPVEFNRKDFVKEHDLNNTMLTQYLNKLEKQGIVNKKRNGRECIITLTEKGIKLNKYFKGIIELLNEE